MKKIMLFASALAGLFLAGSCQRETLEPEQMAGAVKFTVEAPGAIATKTIADGKNVNEVHYEVYKNVTGVDHALLDPASEPMAKGVVKMENKKANITLDLLQDQEYTVIFWAQVADAGHYDTSDLRCIELAQNHQVDANDETRAAFFKRFDFDTYEHKDYSNITLLRPFAQLNLLTTMESLKPVQTGQISGYEIDAKTSEVIITGLAASFNTVTGVGNGVDYPFTFNMAATPEEQGQEILEVNGKEYHYVSMNYMFVPVNAEDGSATVNLDYSIVTDKGTIEHTIANVPIRENYRTNVIGNLFTKESKFEIIVDANFGGQNLVEVWDGREVSEPAKNQAGEYVISTAAELAWLSAAVNGTLPPVAVNGVAQPTPGPQKFSGKTFVLAEDIDLANPSIEIPTTWTPIGAGNNRFEGMFDGQNHTISNLVVKTEGTTHAGLFGRVQSGTVKNVTVVDANVQGHASAAAVVGHGVCAKIENCHVENAVVVSTPINGDEGNNVGAIVGFLGADGGSAWVKDCTVKNADITAYRKVGGIVGAANQAAVVTGNTVKNSFVIADQTPEYKEVKAADLGAVVGFMHAKATEADNTVENVELTHKVNSVEELSNAAPKAFVTLGAGEYNLTDDVTVDKKAIQVREGEVIINGQGNTITAGSDKDYGFIARGADASLILDANLTSIGGGIGVTDGAQAVINGGSIAVNTTNTSARYNIYAVGNGTVVTVNDGIFSFNKPANRRAYIYAGAGATVYVKGGTFGKASTRSGYTAGILGDGAVIITGGTFGFNPSKWVKVGYVAVKNGENWTVEEADQNAYVANADGTAAAYSQAGLEAAVKDGKLEIALTAGTYSLPKNPAGLKLVGLEEDVVLDMQNKKPGVHGSISIENVEIKFSNANYTGFQHTSQEYYKDCTIVGQPFLYGETVVFENCTFEQTSADAYNVWTYGAKNVTFEKCTFNSAGKSILVYTESMPVTSTVTLNSCKINAYAPVEGKAAIEIDSSLISGNYVVNINDTQANGFANGNVSGNSLWNNKKGTKATIFVDGTQVL